MYSYLNERKYWSVLCVWPIYSTRCLFCYLQNLHLDMEKKFVFWISNMKPKKRKNTIRIIWMNYSLLTFFMLKKAKKKCFNKTNFSSIIICFIVYLLHLQNLTVVLVFFCFVWSFSFINDENAAVSHMTSMFSVAVWVCKDEESISAYIQAFQVFFSIPFSFSYTRLFIIHCHSVHLNLLLLLLFSTLSFSAAYTITKQDAYLIELLIKKRTKPTFRKTYLLSVKRL